MIFFFENITSRYEIILTSLHNLFVSFQFIAEFRRFSINGNNVKTFEEFYAFLEKIHKLNEIPFLVGYTDPQGDLLPINNDDNYHKALTTAKPLLKLLVQRKGGCNLFTQVWAVSFKELISLCAAGSL